eukprot:Nitzschia sp. Nitz4//scaffold133_size116822//51475//52287//NITZ4_003804-RA/size116822-processed-gene-0.30-mRNA-1//1//CDS//3329535387//8556//frame0
MAMNNRSKVLFVMDEHHSNPKEQEPQCCDLQDKAGQQLLQTHMEYLRVLVEQGHHSLTCMGSMTSYANKSSLRSQLCCMEKHLEQDWTDGTEDITEVLLSDSNHPFDENFVFEVEEEQHFLDHMQRYQEEEEASLELLEKETTARSGAANTTATTAPAVPTSLICIQVDEDSDKTVPLRGAHETWQAIRYDCILQTECPCCQTPLHVLEDAEYVVCMDCWQVSLVQEAVAGIPLEGDDLNDKFGVALGIKSEEVLRWIQGSHRETSFLSL